jgi:hypothetical protein
MMSPPIRAAMMALVESTLPSAGFFRSRDDNRDLPGAKSANAIKT